MFTKLPCGECKGKCCTFPVFSPSEFQIVKITRGVPADAIVRPMQHEQSYDPGVVRGTPGVVLFRQDGTCPYLTDKGCSIFNLRPKVCRDYGVVADLPCEYLYPKEAEAKQMERIRRST